jgi:hypothetical protein
VITPKAIAACILAASQSYTIPPPILLGVLSAQHGNIGQVVHNADGSDSLGLMQINSIWVPKLASMAGITQEKALHDLRDDACTNINAASWILSQEILTYGTSEEAIGRFPTANPDHVNELNDKGYYSKVNAVAQKYAFIKIPQDISPSTQKIEPDLTTNSAKDKSPSDDGVAITFLLTMFGLIIIGCEPLWKHFFKKYICTKCGSVGYRLVQPGECLSFPVKGRRYVLLSSFACRTQFTA